MSHEEPSTSAEKSKPEGFWGVVRDLGAAGPMAVIAAVLPAIGGIVLLTRLTPIGEFLQGLGPGGVALYIAAFAVLAGFALLPTYAQAILGGWAFGFKIGFPAALAGYFGGALIGYALARSMAAGNVERVLEKHPRWLIVRDALVRANPAMTLGLVTLIRVPPNSPFAMTNLVLGSTRVPVVLYTIGTLVGMAPRTGVAVYLAAQVESLEELEMPRWMIIGGIVVLVAALLLIGHLANRALDRMTGRSASDNPPSSPAH